MSALSPSENPPVTAAGLGVASMNLLAAFGSFTDQQVAALGGAIVLAAAFVAQRFTFPLGRVRKDKRR